MRVLTPDASDVILGRGNASCGHDASQITTRGVGIVHLDGQFEPRLFRSHYIELFHNTRRRHSALRMLTPTEYETINTLINQAA